MAKSIKEQPKIEDYTNPVSVRSISQAGNTVLVEWMVGEEIKRGYIAKNLIINGLVDESILEMATPYGVEWEKIDAKIPSADEFMASLAKELRKNGIWTWADIYTNVTTVQAAINQVTGATLAFFLTEAGKNIK